MRYEVSRNDLAFLMYMRALADQIEREEKAYTRELQDWIEFTMKSGVAVKTIGIPGMIVSINATGAGARSHQVPASPSFPRQVERKDLEVMLAWARGEDILLHVLQRE